MFPSNFSDHGNEEPHVLSPEPAAQPPEAEGRMLSICQAACGSVVIGIFATAAPSIGFPVSPGILMSAAYETLNDRPLLHHEEKQTWKKSTTKLLSRSTTSQFPHWHGMAVGGNEEGSGRRG